MNNAKKIIQDREPAKKKKNTKKNDVLRTKIFLGACVLVVVAICVLVAYENLKPIKLITIDDKNFYESDVMFDIYNAEASGSQMAQFYQQYGQGDYWSTSMDEDGNTGADLVATSAQEAAEQRYILCKKAEEEGFTLSDDQIKEAETTTDELIAKFTDKQKALKGLDRETLLEAEKNQKLADGYKQHVIDGFDIDDDQIRSTVSKKDYRQYTLQYIYAPFTKTGSDGSTTDLTDAEKKALKTKMDDLYKKSKDKSSDFTTLVESGSTDVTYSTKNLIETDKDFLSADLRKQIKAMKRNQTTGVIEYTKDEKDTDSTSGNGYYIVKLVEPNSTEAYEKAVSDAISTEEDSQFNDQYASFQDEFNVEIFDEAWGKLKFGSITL